MNYVTVVNPVKTGPLLALLLLATSMYSTNLAQAAHPLMAGFGIKPYTPRPVEQG